MLVMRHAASSTTSDQPMPISSRFPPVMLASASGANFSGSSPAFAREREVDRVLGEHRDEREDREREALRDVELQRLGRPGEEERRSEDGEPEHDRGAHLVARPAPVMRARAPGTVSRTAAAMASTWPRGPRRALGVLSGTVGVTRPILREAGFGPPRRSTGHSNHGDENGE